MHARSVDDPREFLEALTELAGDYEARHNLIFAIAGRLVATPEVYDAFHLWLAEDAGRPVGAALVTPPWNIVVADEAAVGAAGAIARTAAASGIRVPGATGNRPAIDHFITVWTRLARSGLELAMRHGVFALESVRSVPAIEGSARPATEADRELLIDWIEAFQNEAFVGPPPSIAADVVERMLSFDGTGIWLWEVNGQAVALSGYGGRTPNGIRIGPVYTPLEHRRRGYATSLVAEQSAWLIDEGFHFCFLYTDLANPTSNAIYQRIGYEQVAESAEYRFV